MIASSAPIPHPSLLSSVPPMPSLPFRFRPRCGSLNWSALHALQLSPLIRSVDIGQLQRHLDHLAFSDLTEADLPLFQSASGLHVFRLMQLIIEYLLHVQSVLYHLHADKQSREEEAKEELRKKAREVKDLRKEVKRMKEALDKGGEGGRRRRADREVRPPTLDGPVFACSECDAAFISEEYRASHMQRRHHTRQPRAGPSHSARPVEEEKEQQRPVPSASREARRRDEKRLRQVEAELERERLRGEQRDALLHSSLSASERRQQRAEREREQHWQQLKAEHAQLLHKVEQQQQQQQSAKQQEGDDDGSDSRVSREWLQRWQVEMQQMMESRMNDAFQREESQQKTQLVARIDAIEQQMHSARDERREGQDAALQKVTDALAQLKQDTARLIDVRSQPRHDADMQTEAQEEEVEPPQTPSPPPAREPVSLARQPRYAVFESMPSLLARYPHSPNTVERMVEEVEGKVGEAAAEAAGMDGDPSGLSQQEEQATALQADVEERLRVAEREQGRLLRMREEEERRQQEAVDAEIDLRRRTLEAQKAALLREEEEDAQRTDEQRRAEADALRHEMEREAAQLRRQQRDREEKEEEERWRREEEERHRLRPRAPLRVSPSLVAQQSPLSMPTPAFRLVQASPASATVMRGSPPRPLALEEKHEEEKVDVREGEEREWDWEEEEEKDREEAKKMQQLMRRGAAGSSFRPATTLAERKAALMEKGFSLMQLQKPQPSTAAMERKSPHTAASDSLHLDSASPHTPLTHASRARAKPPARRHTAHASPFRPPSASQASVGSWDE